MLKNAWAGGGEDFQYYVDVAQQQMNYPQQMAYPPIPEPTNDIAALIDLVNSFGWMGWTGLGCFAIGVITVGCFFIGKSKWMPLVSTLFKTWGNLLKGK